jgi:RNA polymerase sigma factor (sigma-70 family)
MTNTDPTHSEPAAEDELSIVRRVAAGEQSAFERLMHRYNRRLYRLARAVLRDEREAEDALQEAYLSAYRLLGQFRGEAALSTWLSRLVLNECLGRLRRSARRHNMVPIVSSDSDIDINSMASGDSDLPDRVLGRAQMRALLEHKVDALPETFRVVFVLRSVEELSVEDTAQCLGIPEETVRSRHFRARSLLRESLAQELDLAERDVFEFGGALCDRIVARVLSRLKP